MLMKLSYSYTTNELELILVDEETKEENLYKLPANVEQTLRTIDCLQSTLVSKKFNEIHYLGYILKMDSKRKSESIQLELEDNFNVTVTGYIEETSILKGIRMFRRTLFDTQKLSTAIPDNVPFNYDSVLEILTILNRTDINIEIDKYGITQFMSSIKPLIYKRYKPYNEGTLLDRLIYSNYTKLPGPKNCEVWSVFNDKFENMVTFKIIRDEEELATINVALDLDKF